jgi:hypothetical protein
LSNKVNQVALDYIPKNKMSIYKSTLTEIVVEISGAG